MRTKRAKTYKRAMAMYTRVFGFRQPYQILINDDLLLKSPPGMNLVKQLEMCVQGDIKIMITQCSIQSLYSLGPSHQPLIEFAKSFERRKCNHRLPLSSHECLTDVIGPNNKHRYILAAQAYGLRKDLEKVPGLPVVHFNPKGVLVLSPFSEASLKVKTGLEEQRRGEGEEIEVGVDKNIILPAGTGTIRSAGLGEANGASGKGPNPLSVKKKK
ncbi:hypothetical protein TREMEDRAFT_17689, partial [Tremella mesenterica DSM 1558]|uniref:uncharacterized protein n=1 Tax=Tremella mesenterica (strain ATCC 24925 / CBS 8224 / DSM 1558 / NBRC 9311 / NRRL Y-6157 / RJB 2259-6 / UBC 559-6) TaxID=578456 RepID=UPI0003F49CD8